MKKIFLLLLFIFLIAGCSSNRVINKLEIDNNFCKIVEEYDTHGGFLGDGDYFAKIECTNLKKSELSDNWKSLPLADELNPIVELKQCDDKECKTFIERYNVPEIANGYYLFVDRFESAKNKYDFVEVNNRSSYNFDLAILDMDNNIIYYYELDT